MDRFLPAAQEGPETIMMDESNNCSDDKACAILVRMVDPTTFQLENRFLGMPIYNIPIGESLFNVLKAILSQYSTEWDNVKGFSSDTASVMVGVRNSVRSRVHEATNNQVIDFECVSHITNLCAIVL